MKTLFYRLFFLALPLLFSSCSTELIKKDPPPKAEVGIQKELDLARVELSKNPERALKRLDMIIQKYSNTSVALDAAKLSGDYHYKNKSLTAALASYGFILNNQYRESYENEIFLNAIRIHLELKNRDLAADLLNQALRTSPLTGLEKMELLKIKIEFLKEAQNIIGQLETLAELHSLSENTQNRSNYKIRATAITDSLYRPQDLDAILSNSKLGFVHPSVHYRLGSVAFEQADFSKARSHFSQVVSLNPESDVAESSKEFLRQLDARSSVDTKTIGVILPLSGKYSDIGKSVLNSIQLGLGIYDRRSNLRLAVIDSEGQYLDARRAVEKLVIEDQVVAIIGSLQSKTATSIASKAQALGVPTVVLSQKSGITQIGDYVFRNALTSEMQVQHLVQMAIEKLGFTRFAILYPEDAYGAEYANLFWDAVQKLGGQIRAAQSYDPKETDFRIPLQKMTGTHYIDDRTIEYKQKLEEWKKKQTAKTARTEVPNDLLAPLVDFQAIFIPDNARALGQIAAMLSFQDIKDISLLGTNLWNTSSVAERAGSFSNSLVFVDSFLNKDPAFENSDFYKRYKLLFGKTPSLFDLQAYDTALILKDAASSVGSRAELQEKLAATSLPSRDFSRPIVALTLSDGKIIRLDQAKAAPSSTKK